MAKKRQRMFYKFECTITGEVFKTTRQAPHVNELMSVRAFYDLNADKDDRPHYIRKQLEQEYAEEQARKELAEAMALEAQQNEDKGVH